MPNIPNSISRKIRQGAQLLPNLCRSPRPPSILPNPQVRPLIPGPVDIEWTLLSSRISVEAEETVQIKPNESDDGVKYAFKVVWPSE